MRFVDNRIAAAVYIIVRGEHLNETLCDRPAAHFGNHL